MTPEEKTAVKLSNLIADLQLDIDMVGIYFANYAHKSIYNRFEIMAESAIQANGEKQERVDRMFD